MDKLLGTNVSIEVSDPWEFEEKNGPGPFHGCITQIKGEDMLVSLSKPIKVKNKTCESLIVSPRHENKVLEDLLSGGRVAASMTAIDSKETMTNDPFIYSSWRSGMGLIGVIYQHI